MIPALCGIPAAVLLLPPQLRPARWLTIRTLSSLPPASRHPQMTAPRIPDNPRVAVGMSLERRWGRVLGALADLGARLPASFERRWGVVRDVFWARFPI